MKANIFLFLAMFYAITLVGQNFTFSSIDKELLVGVEAVIRDTKTEIILHDYNDMTVQNKEVITVLNKRASDQLNFVVYYDNHLKVEECEAFLYDVNGKEVEKFKKKDFLDVSATEGTLYSDHRALVLDFTPTFFPYTIEFNYKTRTSTTAFLPRFIPITQSNISLEKATYTITNQKKIPLKNSLHNLDDYGIIFKEEEGNISIEVDHLKPIKIETLAPNYKQFLPFASFVPEKFQLKNTPAFVKTWEDFGKWQNEKLLKGLDDLPNNTLVQVSNVVSGINSPKEKAKKIYEFMQSKTRYISVQVGIGGWKPTPAQEVDKLGYGDCKGLTNYTKALLKSQGIESYYTIVDSQPNGIDIEEDFVALQGDHVILALPFEEETIFLECTSQDAPFGFLGTHTDNRKVIMVTPKGAEITKTPTYSTSDNLQFSKAKFTLDKNFHLKGVVTIQSKGLVYDQRYGMKDLSDTQKQKHYKNLWDYHNNLHISDVDLQNNKDEVIFTEKMNFVSENYIANAGDRFLFTPNAITRFNEIPKKYKNRELPFEIKRGYTYQDEIEITLPEGFLVESVFEGTNLETPFGNYQISISKKEDNSYFYKRSLVLHSGKWTKEVYNNYIQFLKEVSKKDTSKIVLLKQE